ncbi:hypothetical protein J5277_17970 [Rhizobium sp. 16-449-1b]|uniref:hypothetical protein n=1 Tax=Rhizobium sp. 16-449-1b TaxID=2819989 RepID=UPI001ADB2B6C|nr:hypothetical protein [Rhizobium sp. 16-449-1b]MBO9195993.1 hypothetical protein [Rhizobium sp. 16-449-1b]
MQEWSNVSAVNAALKSLCRELGVERDRQSVLQIATLLMRLSKEGLRDAEDLVKSARTQLGISFNHQETNAVDE